MQNKSCCTTTLNASVGRWFCVLVARYTQSSTQFLCYSPLFTVKVSVSGVETRHQNKHKSTHCWGHLHALHARCWTRHTRRARRIKQDTGQGQGTSGEVEARAPPPPARQTIGRSHIALRVACLLVATRRDAWCLCNYLCSLSPFSPYASTLFSFRVGAFSPPSLRRFATQGLPPLWRAGIGFS